MFIQEKPISSSKLLFNIVEDARCAAMIWVEEHHLQEAVDGDDTDKALDVAKAYPWTWEDWDGFVSCLNQAKPIVNAAVAFTASEAATEARWKELERLTTIMDRFEQLVGDFTDDFIVSDWF